MIGQSVRRTHPRRQPRSSAVGAVRAVALAFALTPLLAGSASAATPVLLGTADSYALLAGSTITNTGPTTITGDIGLCCTGLATTGFGSVSQPGGAQYIGPGSPAATAQDDLDIAYADAAAQPVTNTVPTDLSLTGTPANPLRPGVYESTAHGAMLITTGLTLDFQGNPNAVFVFQATTLITAAGSGGSVTIVNGGSAPSACNIFWQLSDATQGVTLGTASAFKGTTMALGASVLGTGATVEGRILTRRSKAVNLDSNTITRTACAAPASAGGGSGGATTTLIPAVTALVAPPVGTTPSPSPIATPRPGVARLTGPSAPVTGPFTVSVTGPDIQSVVFSIDGRRVKTVPARTGRKKFSLKVDPRRQNRRVHKITAKVTHTPESKQTTTRLRFVYRRPPATPTTPRFTG
jgi:hypothetical protein